MRDISREVKEMQVSTKDISDLALLIKQELNCTIKEAIDIARDLHKEDLKKIIISEE